MMQEAQKLREQMLAEREQLRKDQEAVRLEAEAEKSRLDVRGSPLRACTLACSEVLR